MKIKRLYIGDMGIYRNALMEDISPNIVVIGGLNRAGKTTLLEVMRHLVYGFPKNLRNTKVEYNVESDFVNNNDKYTVRINGLKEPQVICNAEKRLESSSELYKGIDRFTYSKLYTITLDELKKSNVKEDEEKIKAILLGAGLEEAVKIPKLIENFSKAREKIGGKQGNPKTRLFKPHYDNLIKGISEQEEALKQLQQFKEDSQALKAVEEDIENTKAGLIKAENSLIVLEVLKANYEDYKEKNELQLQMEQYDSKDYEAFEQLPSIDRLQAAYSEYQEILKEYESLEESAEQVNYYKRLIQYKDKLIQFERNESGLKQRLQNYSANIKQLQREKENIIIKMNSINDAWKGDFSKVKNISCDFIEESRLSTLVNDIKENEEAVKKINWDIEEQKTNGDILRKELKALKSSDLGAVMKGYFIAALICVFAGAGLLFINKFIGASLSLVGVIAASIYALLKYQAINGSTARRKALEIELNSLQNKIGSLEERKNVLEADLKKLYLNIEKYKQQLCLNRDISAAALYTYYKSVQEIKISIEDFEIKQQNLEGLSNELLKELSELKAFLELFYSPLDESLSKENVFEHSEKLINLLIQLSAQLDKAETYARLEKNYRAIREKTLSLFKIEEDNKEILDRLYSKIQSYKEYNDYKALKAKLQLIEKTITASFTSLSFKTALGKSTFIDKVQEEDYNTFYESYSSLEDINRQYDFFEKEGREIKASLDSLNEKLQRLKIELEHLRTSEKILEAQTLIDNGRAGLEPLALKYAVYSAAENILARVQKSFIQSAKDSLLSGASSILNKITGGEYKSILPGDNLLMSDFKTVTADNEEQSSYDLLSRGTGEQIFLSVRLNRIKETEAKLPIVLDDPFVNFDSFHAVNTLEIIKELSRENQIFILTCHAEIVEAAQGIFENAQYWKLERGNFSLTEGNELINYLSEQKSRN